MDAGRDEVRIEVMQILGENVAALRQVREACLRELIGAAGEVTEKSARPVLLAAIDSLRRHAESSLKLRALLCTVEDREHLERQLEAFEKGVTDAIRRADPETAERVCAALGQHCEQWRAVARRQAAPDEAHDAEE
jgi:hypothetical protein